MTYIINCPFCKQQLKIASDMLGKFSECPSCKRKINISNEWYHNNLSKNSTQQRTIINTTRHHNIFYYVFWGVCSLIGTLMILFVSFLFIGGCIVAHQVSNQMAQQEQQLAVPVPMLPDLTPSEIEHAEYIYRALEHNKDDIDNVVSRRPSIIYDVNGTSSGYKATVYLYIFSYTPTKNDKEEVIRACINHGVDKDVAEQACENYTNTTHVLQWVIRYYGDAWLFIKEYKIKIDNSETITFLPKTSVNRTILKDGDVFETFIENAMDYSEIINKILSGNTITLRMQGTEGRNDIVLDNKTIQQMRDVLLVFRYLGGKWPSQ